MAQSIKLGNDTYLDYSGVTINSSGTTLKTRLDAIEYGNLANQCEQVNSESDVNNKVYGSTIMRTNVNFTLGNITVPAFTRMLKLNYGSADCGLIGITPSGGFVVAFRNNGTWTGRIL